MSGKLSRKKNQLPRSKRTKKMSDTEIAAQTAAAETEGRAIENLKHKQDGTGILQIDRSLDGQSIVIYIKHPLLADIVRKMANGNAPVSAYNAIYKPILAPIPGHTERVWSKPAVSKITKNFIADGDFSWDAPRACLIYNADALEAGYSITYKVEAPFDPGLARKWGKMFRDGCKDIIANAKPFQMTWVMKEKETSDQPVPPDAPIPDPNPTF